MRVLSGIQPSGSLHLGNFFGMMKKMIDYQEQEDLFCFIANYHAMTSLSDGKVLAKGTLEDIPEVQELAWILSNFTPMGLLERCHSYKDKIAQGINANHGLFAYPVLMTADILLYQSDRVPVGKDQKQHLEVARDIAIKYNNEYGDVFTIPEPEIDDEVATVPGLDGRKMSKSYGNTIDLFLDEKPLRKQIMRIVTLFLDKQGVEELRQRYLTPGLRYGDVKQELFETACDFFAPYTEKRKELLADPDNLRKILAQGAEKARYAANKTLRKVRKKGGLRY